MAQITTYATKAVPEGADKTLVTDSGDGSTKNALLSALPISAAAQTALDLKAALAGTSGGKTIIGGTGVTDILKLQGTSGNGTLTSPAIQALVGNNGGTPALSILNNGNVEHQKNVIAAGATSTIRLKGYTVSGLSAITAVQGDTAFVTDALAPTFLGALVGGGAIVVPVFYNGSAWVSY